MRSFPHTLSGVLIGILLTTSLFACSSFSPDEPPLPDSTMVDVLTDLHLAQARVRIHQDTLYTALRDSVLLRHGVPMSRFEDALRYYSEHPDAYLSIHRAIEDSLEMGRRRLLDD